MDERVETHSCSICVFRTYSIFADVFYDRTFLDVDHRIRSNTRGDRQICYQLDVDVDKKSSILCAVDRRVKEIFAHGMYDALSHESPARSETEKIQVSVLSSVGSQLCARCSPRCKIFQACMAILSFVRRHDSLSQTCKTTPIAIRRLRQVKLTEVTPTFSFTSHCDSLMDSPFRFTP